MSELIKETTIVLKTSTAWITTTKHTEPELYFETGDSVVTEDGAVDFEMFRRTSDEAIALQNHADLVLIIERVKRLSFKN